MVPAWMAAPQPVLVVPFADAGNGVADMSILRGEVPAIGGWDWLYAIHSVDHLRSTVGAARLSTGLWNLGVAIDTPRSHYTASGAYLGYLSERAATQLALNPRDLTQAAWVKVTMTTAQTSTGIDGVTNSCTRLTATAGDGTALQTIVAAASTRTFSCYMKRVTGTGTITIQQGATTLDVTALLNSSTFSLVQLSASVLNAVVGIKISSSGDEIDVDCAQFEAGAFATTPIPAAGTRGPDQMTLYVTQPDDAVADNYCSGTYRVSYSVLFDTAPADALVLDIRDSDGVHFQLAYILSGAAKTAIMATDNTHVAAPTVSYEKEVPVPYAVAYGPAGLYNTLGSATATVAFDPVIAIDNNQPTYIGIGCTWGTDGTDGVGKELNGTIKDFAFWAQQLSIDYLSSITG